MGKEINYLELVEELLKNYRKAKFNKKVLGSYHLDRLITVQSIEQNEEESIITSLESAIRNLEKYPEKGGLYYDVIQGFFVGEDKKSFKELMQELGVSQSSIYTYKSNAVEIVTELFKDFYTEEEKLSC